MTKKIIIAVIILLAVTIYGVIIFRYQIIQHYGETAIRKLLPEYVSVEKIKFEFTTSNLVLQNFRISNPPDFPHKYLLEIGEIKCYYRMRGKNILDGLEVVTADFNTPVIVIERLADGRLNLVEMEKVLNKVPAGGVAKAPAGKNMAENIAAKVLGNRKLSDIIKLPQTFTINKGKVILSDAYVSNPPHLITFENVAAGISPVFNDNYSGIRSLTSTGRGIINGYSKQGLYWDIKYNPTTPKLTMSSNFSISNTDILPFEPYYDKYSPVVFKSGTFSGTMIFDFDNGSIGSTNEIHLFNMKFYVKSGYENAVFWDTTVPDLVKYFSTPSGEIVFDFKIKGSMDNMKFYLGPISKAALTSMAVDKISQAIQQASKQGQGQSGSQNVQNYVDLFKGLMKKK